MDVYCICTVSHVIACDVVRLLSVEIGFSIEDAPLLLNSS